MRTTLLGPGLGGAVIFVALHAAAVSPAACLATTAIFVAAIVDARRYILPDAVILPAAVATFALSATQAGWAAAATGGALALPFASLALATRGEVAGWGDVKALLLLGTAFGLEAGCRLLFVAACAGCLWAAASGRFRRGARIPFGPPLALGALSAALIPALRDLPA